MVEFERYVLQSVSVRAHNYGGGEGGGGEKVRCPLYSPPPSSFVLFRTDFALHVFNDGVSKLSDGVAKLGPAH